MNADLKVTFYLKRERKGKKTTRGESPVYPIVGKIIIGKGIAQFGTKLKVEERLWHVQSGRAAGKSAAATELNRRLDKINLGIHTHYRDILNRTGAVTALEVKNAFQGIATGQHTLLVLFDDIMREFYSRVGIDRSLATYRQYTGARKHLQHYIKEKYHVRDIPLSRLDMSFIEGFDFHLRVERKLKPASVNGVIVKLLSASRVALRRNLLSHPPFFGYKLIRPGFENRSLTGSEFKMLASIPLGLPVLDFTRDLFVFACWTGISYSDLKSLTWKEIIREDDGSLWISKSRRKTGVPFNVKLLGIPLRIMEKHSGGSKDGLVFNVYDLVKINKSLKSIAGLCGIDRRLTFHVSRHTFASQVCLSQGVPIESVSRMLGHTDIATTQRYARVNREKIAGDMKALSLRLKNRYPVQTNQ